MMVHEEPSEDTGVTAADLRKLKHRLEDNRPLSRRSQPSDDAADPWEPLREIELTIPGVTFPSDIVAVDGTASNRHPFAACSAVWGNGRAWCALYDLDEPAQNVAACIEAARRTLSTVPSRAGVRLLTDLLDIQQTAANRPSDRAPARYRALKYQLRRVHARPQYLPDRVGGKTGLPRNRLLAAANRLTWVMQRSAVDEILTDNAFTPILTNLATRGGTPTRLRNAYIRMTAKLSRTPLRG